MEGKDYHISESRGQKAGTVEVTEEESYPSDTLVGRSGILIQTMLQCFGKYNLRGYWLLQNWNI